MLRLIVALAIASLCACAATKPAPGAHDRASMGNPDAGDKKQPLMLPNSPAPQGQAAVSPKPGWGDFQVSEEPIRPAWQTALLWLPNRFLDLIDVVRVDAGVGPAVGGVVRVTKWGQAGYRQMMPSSARLGVFGRETPFMLESANEMGVGPAFKQSKDREVCSGEIGLGLDLFIVGGYAGICGDQLLDFFAGLAFFDPSHDDLK
jgi:hypothetical protein